MDFPLQHALVSQGLTEPEGRETGLIHIYQALADDFLYADPNRLVVFGDNHDTSRIHTQLGADAARTKMAFAFIATVRGIPEFTYGSEILMQNPEPKADGRVRQDFPGGWAGDSADGTSGQGLSAEARDAQDYLRRLLSWRRSASAVTSGTLTQFAPENGTYVYFRRDARQLVMVAFNKTGTERRLDTARFAEMIGGNTTARDVLTGRSFALADGITLPPESATILELAGAPPMPAGRHRHGGDAVSTSSRVSSIRGASTCGCRPPTARTRRAVIPSSTCTTGRISSIPRSPTSASTGASTRRSRSSQPQGTLREAIVVGIWNTPKRFEEYMPAKALTEAAALPDGWPDMAWMRKQKVVGDDYLRFIVEELKPWVDAKYRTLPGRADTSIMGSSMGALISLYALTEYPDVFGGAGCVSIHWPLGDGIVADYLARHLPPRDGHRLYFDYGTTTLDAATNRTSAAWTPC